MLQSVYCKSVARFATLLLAITILSGASAFAQHYQRTDLTANSATVSSTAANIDPNLVNSWGLTRSSGSPWWVADNGTGLATLYDLNGVPQSLVVTIPSPDGQNASTPTGAVFNFTQGFPVAEGKPAIFIFVTEDGTIAGWNPGADPTNAIIVVNRNGDAVYKGCALVQTKRGPRLYAANFLAGKIEVFDENFQPVPVGEEAFEHPGLSDRFAPFNVQNIGGNLVVTFAKREPGTADELHGPGLGAVGIFDPAGRLLQHLQRGPWMNAPWGVALAPGDFGAFSHRLLVGNFGDGALHAFNAVSGRFEGALLDENDQPLQIDGLWALGFGGNNTRSGSATELFFTAGPNEEHDGLFGHSLNLLPSGSFPRVSFRASPI